MEHIDMNESVPSLVEHEVFNRLSKFNNLFVHNSYTTEYIPDSVYINNSLKYTEIVPSQTVVLTINHTGISNQYDSTAKNKYPIIFNDQKGRFIGGYIPTDNILSLSDITHDFNEFTKEVITKAMDYIDSNNYDVCESLSKIITPKKEVFLNIGDQIYTLRNVNISSTNHDQFIEKVTEKARTILSKYREQYTQSLTREKARYEKMRKSVRPMPDIPYDVCMKNAMMISKVSNYIVYSFPTNIVVRGAVDESAKKYVLLDTPITYNGIIHFYIDETDTISQVKFTDTTGLKGPKHLHTLNDGSVCTGSTDMIGKKAKKLDEILAFRNKIAETLATINTYSCYIESDKPLWDNLIKKLKEVKAGDMGPVWNIPKKKE